MGKVEAITRAIAAALSFPTTVVCTALMVYFGNSSEIGIDLLSVLKISFAFFVAASVVLFAVQIPFLYFFKGKGFACVNACLLVAGYWFWLQAHVFNWNLTGPHLAVMSFRGYIHWGVLEVVVWLVVVLLTIVFFKFLSRSSIQLVCVLMATQVVCIVPLFFKEVQSTEHVRRNYGEFELTLNHFFDYSQDGDVYILLCDALGASLFNAISTQVPYHEKFKDFTYFQNNYTFIPATTWAIPQIFGGICPSGSAKPMGSDIFFRTVFSQKTLLDDLTENGYECRTYSWAPSTLYLDQRNIKNVRKLENYTVSIQNLSTPLVVSQVGRIAGLTAFRLSPLGLKWVFRDELLEGRFLMSKALQEDILNSEYVPMFIRAEDEYFAKKSHSVPWSFTPQQKQFKFVHFERPHISGVQVNEDGEFTSHEAKEVLEIVCSILERLKERGGYDNSLIIVMADHGEWIAPPRFFQANTAAPYRPLFLVKRPMDTHDTLQVNSNRVTLNDIRNAILTELNLPRPDDAFSWFEVPEEILEQRDAEWSAFLDELERFEKIHHNFSPNIHQVKRPILYYEKQL